MISAKARRENKKKEDHVFFSPNGFFRPHRIFLSEQLFFVWSVFFCSGDWQNKNKAADCSFPGSQDTSFDWFDWKHLLGKQNAQRTKYEIGMRCSNQNAETGVWEQVSASNGFSNYLALCVLRSFSKPLPLPKGTVGGGGQRPPQEKSSTSGLQSHHHRQKNRTVCVLWEQSCPRKFLRQTAN